MTWAPPSAAPAGWYPTGLDQARLWDGRTWTEHIVYLQPPVVAVEVPVVRSLAGVLLGFVGMLVIGAIAGAVGDVVAGAVGAVVGAFVGIWGSLYAASALAASRSNVTFRSLFGPVPRHRILPLCALGVAFGLAIRVVSSLVVVPLLPLLPDDFATTGDSLKLTDIDTSSGLFVAVAVAAVVGAPLFEELFFRGVLQPTMQARVGVRWALYLQGLIFASIHMNVDNSAVANMTTFSVIAVCGVSLGWIRNKYQSLLPCIIAHATFNALAVGFMLAAPWLEQFANQSGR